MTRMPEMFGVIKNPFRPSIIRNHWLQNSTEAHFLSRELFSNSTRINFIIINTHLTGWITQIKQQRPAEYTDLFLWLKTLFIPIRIHWSLVCNHTVFRVYLSTWNISKLRRKKVGTNKIVMHSLCSILFSKIATLPSWISIKQTKWLLIFSQDIYRYPWHHSISNIKILTQHRFKACSSSICNRSRTSNNSTKHSKVKCTWLSIRGKIKKTRSIRGNSTPGLLGITIIDNKFSLHQYLLVVVCRCCAQSPLNLNFHSNYRT